MCELAIKVLFSHLEESCDVIFPPAYLQWHLLLLLRHLVAHPLKNYLLFKHNFGKKYFHKYVLDVNRTKLL